MLKRFLFLFFPSIFLEFQEIIFHYYIITYSHSQSVSNFWNTKGLVWIGLESVESNWKAREKTDPMHFQLSSVCQSSPNSIEFLDLTVTVIFFSYFPVNPILIFHNGNGPRPNSANPDFLLLEFPSGFWLRWEFGNSYDSAQLNSGSCCSAAHLFLSGNYH